MPTSLPTDIRFAIACASEIAPSSILDIGIGFGRWGFLFREFFDVFSGRIYKDKWLMRIDGVEVFEPYIMEHQRSLYTNIYIEDARTYIGRSPQYDLTIIGDMLEHLEMDEAVAFFHAVMSKTNGGLLINIPLGKCEQDGLENPYETHRSTWVKDDMMLLNPTKFQIYNRGEYGTHGTFFFRKTDYIYFRAIEEGQRMDAAGLLDNSNACYERARLMAPNRPDAYLSLAGTALQKGNVARGVELLQQAITVAPDTKEAYISLASLLIKLGRKADATSTIDIGLARFADNPDVIAELNSLWEFCKQKGN